MVLQGTHCHRLRWFPLSACTCGFLVCSLLVCGLLMGCDPAAQEDSAIRLLSESQDNHQFQQAHPKTALSFPRDHGKHPNFKHEWWYLTANLRPTTTDNTPKPSDTTDEYRYGIQWTLFRHALAPSAPVITAKPSEINWQTPAIYLGHAALSTPQRHFFAQRYARAGIRLANVSLNPLSSENDDIEYPSMPAWQNQLDPWPLSYQPNFNAWIDNWFITGYYGSPSPSSLHSTTTQQTTTPQTAVNQTTHSDLKQLVVSASTDTFRYQLVLNNQGPLILQGEQGFSAKQAQASTGSHYYSQPFMSASGWLEVPYENSQPSDQTIQEPNQALQTSTQPIKTPMRRIHVEGFAWLDREWSSQALTKHQSGWDWFSLHLANGNKLMLYQLRNKQDRPFIVGTWIQQDGTTQHLSSDMISLRPLRLAHVAKRNLPMDWEIQIPELTLDITAHALHDQQWLATDLPYWEGVIHVKGSHTGVGYMELTGYTRQ